MNRKSDKILKELLNKATVFERSDYVIQPIPFESSPALVALQKKRKKLRDRTIAFVSASPSEGK